MGGCYRERRRFARPDPHLYNPAFQLASPFAARIVDATICGDTPDRRPELCTKAAAA
jgi:hypothetical protein